MKVLIKRLDPELPLPRFAKAGDAGADVYSRIDVTIAPSERALIPTGIAIALPPGYATFAHPRSGLAAKHGIAMVNAPGTIDAGFRGEINILLINLDPHEVFFIRRGERVAQLVFQQVEYPEFVEVEELPGSDRGFKGFGSTGRA